MYDYLIVGAGLFGAVFAQQAKEKGKRLGKPPIKYPDNWQDIYQIWKSGSITAREAMKRLNLKPTSFYKLAKNYKG